MALCQSRAVVARGWPPPNDNPMSLTRRSVCLLPSLGWPVIAARAAEPAPLRVGWGDYPPFQVRGARGAEGLDVELLEQLAAAAGERLQWLRLPFARQLSDLASGELDVVASATHAPERLAIGDYTAPYRQERVALLTLSSGAPVLHRLADLKGQPVRIGMIRGAVFPAAVRRELEQLELTPALVTLHANDLTLSALRNRRVDYVIEDPVTILYRASHAPGETVVVALELAVSPVHLLVSRRLLERRPELLPRLNQGLQRARAQPAWAQALARYPGLL